MLKYLVFDIQISVLLINLTSFPKVKTGICIVLIMFRRIRFRSFGTEAAAPEVKQAAKPLTLAELSNKVENVIISGHVFGFTGLGLGIFAYCYGSDKLDSVHENMRRIQRRLDHICREIDGFRSSTSGKLSGTDKTTKSNQEMISNIYERIKRLEKSNESINNVDLNDRIKKLEKLREAKIPNKVINDIQSDLIKLNQKIDQLNSKQNSTSQK